MGHLVFFVLDLIALLAGFVFLFITIPAHLIYAAIRSRKASSQRDSPSPSTHVRCPDCRELVHKEAHVCKHCGCKLVPQK
jgi:hypothetical protein